MKARNSVVALAMALLTLTACEGDPVGNDRPDPVPEISRFTIGAIFLDPRNGEEIDRVPSHADSFAVLDAPLADPLIEQVDRVIGVALLHPVTGDTVAKLPEGAASYVSIEAPHTVVRFPIPGPREWCYPAGPDKGQWECSTTKR